MAEKAKRPRDDDDDFEDEPKPKKKAKRPRDDDEDDYDDAPPPPKRKSRNAVETIIPYKNGMALAAYYCGVFGLIPFLGFALGLVAIVLGIIGATKAKVSGGMGHAIAGIILGVIDLALWPILFFVFFPK